MVPVLDMANHSHSQTAYYDEDDEDNIVLLSRPGREISIGDEVNISYGEKSHAEMIFSYGFIDRESSVEELTLPLESLADDPLAKAKLHIFRGSPTLKLSRSDGEINWQCPFVYLMCLNEEDGLEFRVLQGTNGDRELRLFWQEEDATARANDFGDLIKNHPLCQIFRLRAVSVLHEVVTDHLMQLSSEISHDELEPLRRTGQIRDGRLQLAQKLREIEASVLESAAIALDEQVCTSVFLLLFTSAHPSMTDDVAKKSTSRVAQGTMTCHSLPYTQWCYFFEFPCFMYAVLSKQHLDQTLPQIPRKFPQVLECQGTFSAFLAY